MDRIEQIKKMHHRRTLKTKNIARSALAKMINENARITFKALSRKSGISTSTLYYHEDLRDEIIAARNAYREASSSRTALSGKADANEMQNEIKRLTDELSMHMEGIVFDSLWDEDDFDW